MPAEDTRRPTAPSNRRVHERTATPTRRGGFLIVHPHHQVEFARHGLGTPEAVLALPGEVVSGHPDRHVVQVHVPTHGGRKQVAYLKRQHVVSWKERLRNALVGFGFVSKSVREAALLTQLDAEAFAVPEWLAYGESGDGRAFLLVVAVPGALELRSFLSNPRTSAEDRRRCAERIGQAFAELHAAGFHHPDATAKHVFVNPRTLAITLIDWQSARRIGEMTVDHRLCSLAALHASLADGLATSRERSRALWAYRRVIRRADRSWLPRFASSVKAIAALAERIGTRRSIRDQREAPPVANAQRLVWLKGEAVCVVPDLATVWPEPADGAPFYEPMRPVEGGLEGVTFADGRTGWLIRNHSLAPLSRMVARLRGKPWRSPDATLARVLFHLERYGVPAPRLLAFGQKLTSRWRAESFLVYEPPADGVAFEDWYDGRRESRRRVLNAAGLVLRQLHDAGCRLDGPFTNEPVFQITSRDALTPVVLGAVQAVRLTRRVADRVRVHDLRRLLRGPLAVLEPRDCLSLLRGYFGSRWTEGHARKFGIANSHQDSPA